MPWPYLLSHAVTVVSVSSSVLASLHLLSSRRSSQSTIAWLLGFIFVPEVAVPLYIVFGSRKRAQPLLELPQPEDAQRAALPPPPSRPVEHVLFSAGIDPATSDNELAILGDGVGAFKALTSLIAQAQKRIYITMFILGDDDTGREIVSLLSRRAQEGLEVKLIMDAVGSRQMRRRATQELQAAGAEVRTFMPLLRVPFRGSGNLRSHRKLVIVDGCAVFTGGMNLANEYMGKAPLEGRFRDIGAIATGSVADSAERLFLSDWYFCGGNREKILPRARAGHPGAGNRRLQFVPSGPDRPDDALYDALLVAIGRAVRRVRIVSPYYIPDEPLQRALVLAGRSGIDTTLVMPTRSNHAIADVARRPFLRELAGAGVRLFGYPHGMVHAKALVVDDCFAYVGSPNMDVRSLLLNYENAIFAYDEHSVAEIDSFIEGLLAESLQDGLHTKRRAWPIEPLARLVAPEL
jgi:cardiolipin synthase